MAQLVLGVVGAVVGSFIPGVGTAIGWAIGSAIGSLIDPPKGPTVEGPRLSDLKTQTADYGTVLPVIYGTVRMAGNVLWSDVIKEKKVKKKEGGKGGPTQTTITYVYTVSYAVGICEGVIEGIRRIWANGELIYSATESSTAGTISESGKAKGGFRVYKGTDDQLPDPTIEAVKGVGNTVPYRNVAYIVFTDLDLERFGRRMPNLEFEVVKEGTTVGYRDLRDAYSPNIMTAPEWIENLPGIDSPPNSWSGMAGPIGPKLVSSNGGFFRLSSYVRLAPGNISNEVQSAPGKIWDLNVGVAADDPVQVIQNVQGVEDRPGPWQTVAKTIDGVVHDMGSICKLGDGFVDLFVPRNGTGEIAKKLGDSGHLMWGGVYRPGLIDAADFYLHGTRDLSSAFPPADAGRYFMGASGSSDGNRMIVFSGPSPFTFDPDLSANMADKWYIFQIVNGTPRCTDHGFLDQARNVTIQLGGLGLGKGLGPFGGSGGFYRTACGCIDNTGTEFWSANNFATYLYTFDGGVLTLSNQSAHSNGPLGQAHSSSDYCTVFVKNGICVFFSHEIFSEGSPSIDYLCVSTSNPYLQKSAVPVSSIVSDQLERVGFSPEEYDVTQLVDDLVDGFFLANRPSVRTAIETLTGPYYFDAVESDDVLKFVKRGQSPVRTLQAEVDMGAGTGDPTDRPETLTITRQQELSQPLEISAQYQDRDADYRIGVQYARRLLTEAINEVSIQLPLVLSGTKAKQVVDAVLFNSWMEREKFEFSTDMRHIDLEPTDVVQLISMAGNLWTVRLTSRSEGGDGTIKWEGVAEEASVYDPLATGVYVPPTSGDQLDGAVPTFQLVFNAPPLYNTIDAPGWYVAATGYTRGWAGSVAMRSLDNGQNYSVMDSSVVDRSQDSAMGYAVTVLGGWDGGNILDTKNSVTVSVVGLGEMASASPAAVLNGSNYIWLGGEVLQFETAEQLTAQTYKLSRLRRGRFGTERFINTHASNESWALLDTNETQFQSDALGNVGVQQLVRGVSLDNEDPSTVPASQFVFDGTVVRPLAPAQAYGVTQPDGAVSFKWVRRSRINGEWLDQIDVPLDEPVEAYELDISTDSNFTTIVRVATSSLPGYEYTAADRVADTGSTVGTLWARVYQMSTRVGRGFPTTFELV